MTRFTKEDKKIIANYRKQVVHEEDLWPGDQGRIVGYRCKRCKRVFPLDIMEVDHIIPLHRGGTDRPDNLQLLCPKCNKTKGSKIQKTDKKAKTGSRLKKASSVTKVKINTKKTQ